MKIFYFTATGNSLYAARRFEGAELLSIPALLRGSERAFADDALGLVFPVYCLGLPKIVRTFLQTVSLKTDYLFAVMTCGNTAGDCGGLLQTFLARNNQRLNYANQLVMPDNYLPFFDAAKQAARKLDINAAAAAIVGDVAARRPGVRRSNLFVRPFARAAQLFQPLLFRVCRKFVVSDACTGCGICGRVCPVGNVAMTEQRRPAFGRTCEGCLACVHNCPARAIRIPYERNRKERYRNPNVDLLDIIDANGGE